VGPFSLHILEKMKRSGLITDDTEVLGEEEGEWKRIGDLETGGEERLRQSSREQPQPFSPPFVLPGPTVVPSNKTRNFLPPILQPKVRSSESSVEPHDTVTQSNPGPEPRTFPPSSRMGRKGLKVVWGIFGIGGVLFVILWMVAPGVREDESPQAFRSSTPSEDSQFVRMSSLVRGDTLFIGGDTLVGGGGGLIGNPKDMDKGLWNQWYTRNSLTYMVIQRLKERDPKGRPIWNMLGHFRIGKIDSTEVLQPSLGGCGHRSSVRTEYKGSGEPFLWGLVVRDKGLERNGYVIFSNVNRAWKLDTSTMSLRNVPPKDIVCWNEIID